MSNFGNVNQSQNLPPINGQSPNMTNMSKVTVAPPIPSYYRTNINNFTSNLPNLSFQTPGNIAKTFSQKFFPESFSESLRFNFIFVRRILFQKKSPPFLIAGPFPLYVRGKLRFCAN